MYNAVSYRIKIEWDAFSLVDQPRESYSDIAANNIIKSAYLIPVKKAG